MPDKKGSVTAADILKLAAEQDASDKGNPTAAQILKIAEQGDEGLQSATSATDASQPIAANPAQQETQQPDRKSVV